MGKPSLIESLTRFKDEDVTGGDCSKCSFHTQSLARQTKGAVSEIAIFKAVKQWKQNRRLSLQDEEMAQAICDLNVLGWLRAQVSEDLLLPREALIDT